MKLTFIVVVTFAIIGMNILQGSMVIGELSIENDLQDLVSPNQDIMEFGIFKSSWLLILKIMRTLKGLKCMIEWTLGIENAALKFTKDIEACGGNVTQEVQELVDANKAILETCKEINELRKTVCKDDLNGSDHHNHNENGNTNTKRSNKIGTICYIKASIKFRKLYQEVNDAIELAKKVPNTGANASKCSRDAVNDLMAYFTQSESIVEQCLDEI